MVHVFLKALVVSLFLLTPLFTGMSNAQDHYTRLWAEVDSLEQRGLPESAREKALAIYDLAVSDENGAQTIKALLFVSKYTTMIEEDEANKILSTLRDNLDIVDDASRGLLHAVLGELYWQYYQSKRFEILDRTYEPGGDLPDDIGEWDARQLVQVSIDHFDRALADSEVLQTIPTERFAEILQDTQADFAYRPTLYDLVAHWAIDLWMHQDAGIARPQRPFSLNNKNMFAAAQEYVNLVLPDNDSLSLKYKTAVAFQDLLRFRIADGDVQALVDADLKRLGYMLNNSTFEGSEAAYEEALDSLAGTAGDHEIGATVVAAKATHLVRLAGKYNPFDDEELHRWDNIRALEVCEDAQARWPESRGARSCRGLSASIQRSVLSIETASVIPVGKHFLGRVEFSNVPAVSTSIVKISREVLDRLNRSRNDDRRSMLKSLSESESAVRQSFELPDESDFQRHTTEISLEPLRHGLYIIIVSPASPQETVDPGFTTFQVSDIGYISRSRDDGTIEVLAVSRSDGEPLTDATIVLWERTFRRAERDYQYERISEHEVDGHGCTRLPVVQNNQNLLSIEWNDQHLWTDQRLYANRRSRRTQSRPTTYFFTDRAIYRPGQVVYYKGIIVDREGKETSLAVERETSVVFRDVNGQEIASTSHTTNKFGSISGSFRIPSSVLPGEMSISDPHGSVGFSVEEYRRPRFEVDLDEVAGTPVLGDQVIVSGSAETFFGAPITNSTVVYRVTRSSYYHPWWSFERSIWPRSVPAEIASGETETDASGTFSFGFTATPDESSPLSGNPLFSFVVEVAVTDISGETISTSTEILVNASGLVVALNAPRSFDLQEIPDIPIVATNPNGVDVRAVGTVTVSRLQTPDYASRRRLWSPVDTTILSEEYIHRYHPLDRMPLRHGSLPSAGQDISWSVEISSETTLDSTRLANLTPGIYRIKIDAADDAGRSATSEMVATIYDSESESAAASYILWSSPGRSTLEVGQTARIAVASALDTRVLFEVEVDGELVRSEWIRVDKRQQTIEVPVVENYQGGFAARLVSVQADRVFIEEHQYHVPHVDRKLEIATGTFRSTLRPGDEELWRFTIKTEDGSPAVAEAMATMYDASLDALRPHSWAFDVTWHNYVRTRWTPGNLWGTTIVHVPFPHRGSYPGQVVYPRFNWFGLSLHNAIMFMRNAGNPELAQAAVKESVESDLADDSSIPPEPEESESDNVQVRRNLNELAFFRPAVRTDSLGNFSIEFAIPEALTRWKLMTLAHTPDLKTGSFDADVVTRKELMVVPNPPRYLRVGDRVELSTKITNLTDTLQSGSVMLELEDPADGASVARLFGLDEAEQSFSVDSMGNAVASWLITVPSGFEHIVYRIVATSSTHSDGEESALAILDNRILVTESMPLWINGEGEKQFTFDRLADPPSSSLETYRVSLEYASNPAWYAVQSLPYLAQYPHEGAEHVFSRLYANAISRMLVQSNPDIEHVMREWETEYPDALESNLMKNEQLKAVAAKETPWINDAIDEVDRKKAISSLFNDRNIQNGLSEALLRLEQLQLPEGAWPWFAGMRPNRFVTQHIVKGLGWLRSIGALDIDGVDRRFSPMTRNALEYLDHALVEDYKRLVDRKADLDERHITSLQVHYLYTRTLFQDFQLVADHDTVYQYYLNQATKYWTEMPLYEKALLAAVFHRTGLSVDSRDVRSSILEFSIVSDELGMYWKMNSGLRWNEAPIETQAQIVASFIETGGSDEHVALMQRWLLRNKQTHNWKSTRATTDAVFALLRSESSLIKGEGSVKLHVGDQVFESGGVESEPGTGYISSAWTAEEDYGELARVQVVSTRPGTSWGALYWQYFEQVDKVSRSGGPLAIEKSLYRKDLTPEGPVLTKVQEGTVLEPGDLLTVQLTVNTDRDLEYVHLKDMRAAGTEPLSAISGYKWKSGLGYYEAISDASVSFFFDYLPRGTRVIEVDLRVNLNGSFGVGPARLQSMYAPEFVAYSSGQNLRVAQGSPSDE